MPPARTIIRRSNLKNLSVTDLQSTYDRDLRKPSYVNINRQKTKNNYGESKEKPWKHNNNNENNKKEQNYMDLDEFLQKSDNNNESDSGNSRMNDDYPKPSVDLLASLLTLGKMIKNQKRLIQNQRQTESVISDKAPSMLSSPTNLNCDLMSISSSKDKMCIDKRSDKIADNTIVQHHDDKDDSLSSKRQVIPEEIKDIDYWDRRKRNNLAAKKSREERRKKELEVIEMTKELEIENSQLTVMLKRLTARNEWLESRAQNIQSYKGSIAESSSSLSSAEYGL